MSNLESNPQAVVQQLVQAANSLTDEQASERYEAILDKLPPEAAAQLNALAFTQLSDDDRSEVASQFAQAHNDSARPFAGFSFNSRDEAANPVNLGQMSALAQQQDPALVQNIFGRNSPIAGTLGKAALSALAALLLRRMMSGQGQQGGTQQGGDLGSILGGLLGGQAQQGVPSRRQQPVPPGDLGSILGGLLGGQAGQGGHGAQPAPGGLDLGSILGGLLGGGAQQPQQSPAPGTTGSHRREGLHIPTEEDKS